MANKPLHEYNPFRGNEGFIIVDGLDNTASGGILKFPNYAGKTDGAVLTKKTVNNADEIVWEVPQGGGGLPDHHDLIGKNVGSGGAGKATLKVNYVANSNGEITTVEDPYWEP
jgi:hypothetical protein